MSEKTLELELALLLPGVESEKDACLARLESSLRRRRGLLRAHIENEVEPARLCLHFDPELISSDDLRRMARRAGARILDRYRHRTFEIENMDCSDCALVLEHGLSREPGVLAVSANYAGEVVSLEYDARATNLRKIERRVRRLGYEVRQFGIRSWYQRNLELLRVGVVGALTLSAWLTARFGQPTLLVSLGMMIPAYVLGSLVPLRHAWTALRQRRFETDLLMVLAALGAAALGNFVEGGLLLFLFGLGHALEGRALDRARRAIRALGELAPRTALVRREGEEVEVPLPAIEIGDLVIVRPGARLPVDGEIISGSSLIDQSPLTGESAPILGQPGQQVYAGSTNGDGALELRVSRLARDSTLARVVELVERARASKSPIHQASEKFIGFYVPLVLLGAVLLIALPPIFGIPFSTAFSRAMTLLVAASPCALALGTPSAVLAGVARAARSGVLIKGGVHLENLGRIKLVAFDKTGTVTAGKMRVTEVLAFEGSKEGLLEIAAGIETRSDHPLARAIVEHAEAARIEARIPDQVRNYPGKGATAIVGGERFYIGSRDFLDEFALAENARLPDMLPELEQSGKTLVYLAREAQIIGVLALADQPRAEAPAMIAELKRMGLERSVMLSGDQPLVAAAIAAQVGIEDVHAGLLPEQKLQVLENLAAAHGPVGMVGDGVNDAPSLAQATVGIAMGGMGTAVALEAADVVLMADDLQKLPYAIQLGRATLTIIHQNMWISIGVIGVLISLALSGLAGIGVTILMHEGSTVGVVLNAMRLLAFEEQDTAIYDPPGGE